MKGLFKYIIIEIKLFLREPEAAFFTLVFPVLLLFVFGSIFGNKPTPFYNGQGYVDMMTPAFSAIIIATGGLMSLTIGIASYREKGILKRFKASAFKPSTILAAQFFVIFFAVVFGMIFLIIVAKIFYNLQFEGSITGFIFSFILSCLSIFSIGFILGSLISTARGAQIAANVVYFPLIFLSGATIPAVFFPQTVKKLSEYIPLTHSVKLLQGFWFGTSWAEHLTSVIVLSLIFLVCSIISIIIFRWE